MSDMLEQAIIDADALKEAATKNAETLVLEKYSNQIKSAVENLLEQEDPAAMMDAELGAAPEAAGAPEAMAAAPPTEESSVMEHIPLAVTSENDEQVEIPLDKLLEEVTKLSETMRYGGDFIDDPDLQEHSLVEFDDDMLVELEEERFRLAPGPVSHDPVFEDLDLYEEELDEELNEEEGLDDFMESLEESLTVDIHPEKSGWAGTPASVVQLAEEEILALEQDSKVREEKAALRKAVKDLDAVNETVTKQNEKLIKSLDKSASYMTKLRDVVIVLEKKLDKANLANAKLIYQNKALTSDSLNERQKQKLAEAVSSAGTIEEAKVIFETLQNTVGSTSRKTQPNSLSEAVQKSSSIILSSRNETNSGEQKNNPTLDRWKFLAGIDKQ